MRDNHVLEFLIDFDNLELHLLSDVFVEITDWLDVYCEPGKLPNQNVHNQTTFGAALDRALMIMSSSLALFTLSQAS